MIGGNDYVEFVAMTGFSFLRFISKGNCDSSVSSMTLSIKR